MQTFNSGNSNSNNTTAHKLKFSHTRSQKKSCKPTISDERTRTAFTYYFIDTQDQNCNCFICRDLARYRKKTNETVQETWTRT